MKRPWQIWMLFLFSLALVIPAMAWLTVKALELDRNEAEAQRQALESRRLESEARRQAQAAGRLADLARQQAELQERVSSVLWRMDWELTPLVAQEAARPHFVYQPFYAANVPASGKPVKGGPGPEGEVRLVPSPLLVQPSEYVLLHFQCTPGNSFSSPQNPTGATVVAAIENGATASNIELSGLRMAQLEDDIDYGRLLSMLPERMLPPVEVKSFAMANNFSLNYNGDPLSQQTGNQYNDLGLQQLDQQIEQQAQSPADGAQFDAPQATQPSNLGRQQAANSSANPPPTIGPTPQPPGPPGTTPGIEYVNPTAPPTSQVGSTPEGGGTSQPQGQGGQAQGQGGQPQGYSQGFGGGYAPDLSESQIAALDRYMTANTREQARRGGEEWQGRNAAYQVYAQTQALQQRANTTEPHPESSRHFVGEGVSRPVWIGSKLILARRVSIDGAVVIQGCWLNWPRIEQSLLAEARQILPEVELAPVTPQSNVQPGRMLATLPVQLVVPEPTISSSVLEFELVPSEVLQLPAWSAIRVSLVIAWICLVLATVAVGILLQGAVTLSERRGAFVAAVTHELRTPLTTFRMYAEMLSAGMIPAGEKQQQYLETLRVEADRLSHLVENVLAYARLERGRPGKRREEVSIAGLLDRVESRLADRARQAEMKLVVEADEAARKCVVHTDPGAVEQILFNLVDNACKYAAGAEDRRLHLQVEQRDAVAEIRVRDHGPGIAPEEARKLFHPFSKSVHQAASTAPGVGLGLALCRRLARALGGRLELESCDDGACFLLTLPCK